MSGQSYFPKTGPPGSLPSSRDPPPSSGRHLHQPLHSFLVSIPQLGLMNYAQPNLVAPNHEREKLDGQMQMVEPIEQRPMKTAKVISYEYWKVPMNCKNTYHCWLLILSLYSSYYAYQTELNAMLTGQGFRGCAVLFLWKLTSNLLLFAIITRFGGSNTLWRAACLPW